MADCDNKHLPHKSYRYTSTHRSDVLQLTVVWSDNSNIKYRVRDLPYILIDNVSWNFIVGGKRFNYMNESIVNRHFFDGLSMPHSDYVIIPNDLKLINGDKYIVHFNVYNDRSIVPDNLDLDVTVNFNADRYNMIKEINLIV